jgi:hypothetical protein
MLSAKFLPNGDYVPAGEAVTVFEDRRDAECGRRFDEARVVEEHPHTGDDRRLLDQDGVVSDQEEVLQDGRDGRRPPSGWMQITSTSGARAFTT